MFEFVEKAFDTVALTITGMIVREFAGAGWDRWYHRLHSVVTQALTNAVGILILEIWSEPPPASAKRTQRTRKSMFHWREATVFSESYSRMDMPEAKGVSPISLACQRAGVPT